MTMSFFKVVSWNSDKIITEVAILSSAKKHARSMGHTGEINPWSNGKWYNPIAYVENEAGECVYNPRFKVKGESTGENQ